MVELPPLADQFRQAILAWSRDNLRSFPWREPDATPFEVLIAEIFLQQTRSETVARILPDVLATYPTPGTLARAKRDQLVALIKPLGLYRHRADALLEIGEELQDDPIPATEKELMTLPQVGKYVANATLCFGHGKQRPILDTNVRRVYERLFPDPMFADRTNSEQWAVAEQMLPQDHAARYNMALLDFGALICTDSTPECRTCFANAYCGYSQEEGGNTPGTADSSGSC